MTRRASSSPAGRPSAVQVPCPRRVHGPWCRCRRNAFIRVNVSAFPRSAATVRWRGFSNGIKLLGGVDEFDQAQSCGESDDGSEVSCGLLASEGDALEALQPTDALLDAGPGLVKGASEEGRLVLLVRFVGDHRGDTARPRGVSVGFAGIALVADHGTGLKIGADVEQGFEVSPVGSFTAGQIKGDDVAGSVGLGMDLRGEAAARATEGLSVLPPFAPAADTWARTIVESNI